MTYLLEPPLIDLVEYGKGRKSPPVGRSFASHIALMADMVIRRYMPAQELEGVRACLRQQLRILRWKSYSWFIPMGSERFTNTAFDVEGFSYVLPNSLVATTLLYRGALDESGTGLARLVFADLVNGLEWACYSGLYGYPLEGSDQPTLVSEEAVHGFISWHQAAKAARG
jgi:hypothetical protein